MLPTISVLQLRSEESRNEQTEKGRRAAYKMTLSDMDIRPWPPHHWTHASLLGDNQQNICALASVLSSWTQLNAIQVN